MPKLFLLIISAAFLLNGIAEAQDRDLDFYIQTGIKNSPVLTNYSNELLSLSIDSSIVRAFGKSNVNVSSQALYAPASDNFGYDSAITNGGNYSALVNLTQPILSNPVKKANFQALSVSGQSLLASIKLSESDLKKEITEQYLTAFFDYSRYESYQAILKLLQNQQSILKQLVEKGVYPQTDMVILILSVEAREVSIREAFIQYKNDIGILNFTCGLTDSSSITLQKPSIILQNDFNIINSPLMMQLKIDSLKNLSDKLLIDVNYKPRLNSFADAGFNAINPKNIPDNFGASIGLNFSVPIYDGKRRQFLYNKIDLNEKTRVSRVEFYNKQFNQQRIRLTEQLKLTEGLIEDIKKQISDQKQLLTIYQEEIEKGIARVIDYLLMINNYAITVTNLTKYEIDRLQIINQMNYLK